ncbi:MAG: transcriptional regulator, AsnC family [Frankiales bacterium]|jgi:DNA-binding Lrp family transcriptional regulator|nr:transcriptional regulator, AsnC family [Frankiales bacterium]MCW2585039.1 transcriptional regulator, AsnC family [Frankiales bacterium]
MSTLDALDRALLRLLLDEPRLGVLETSRRLGVARGTTQARLTRLERAGVLRDWAPTVDPAGLGFAVTAFTTLEVHQGRGIRQISEHLRSIPEVLEAHTTSGQGDLLCRIVARDHADLQRVLDAITSTQLVARTSTVISLTNEVPYRVAQLLDGP